MFCVSRRVVHVGFQRHRSSKMNKATVEEKHQPDRCRTSYPTFPPPHLSQVTHMDTISLRKQQRSACQDVGLNPTSPQELPPGSRPRSTRPLCLLEPPPPRGTCTPQAATVQNSDYRSDRGKMSVCAQLAPARPPGATCI